MSSKATLDRYKSILDSLMSFLHQNDKKYGKEKVYSQEELNRILPDDVAHWMKLRSFGTPNFMRTQNLQGQTHSSFTRKLSCFSFQIA
jgi:hypothetical protein